MTRRSQVARAIRNVDDILHLTTGKRLKDVVGNSINVFGEQLAKKAAGLFSGENINELPPDSPYRILLINPDAPDFLVKAAYRAMQKKYHPDGETPDEAMSKLVNEAYEKICLEREIV